MNHSKQTDGTSTASNNSSISHEPLGRRAPMLSFSPRVFTFLPPNPKGIGSFSPGLRGTSDPGINHRENHQPCKGCVTASNGPFSPPCPEIDNRARDR